MVDCIFQKLLIIYQQRNHAAVALGIAALTP
jgi:hypothetical protein